MNVSFKRTKLFFAFGVVIVALSVVVVNFTNVCRLEAVTLNDEPFNDWPSSFDMLRKKSLFRQPLDSLARVVLADEGTFKVDISCSWPHTLNIRTNAFSPTCFLLDKTSGRLYGLEENGRIVPLQNAVTDWERPILTGVESGRWFGYCRDVRVKVIVDQLEKLRNSNLNLFRLIDEIDLETMSYVQVSVSGLPYRLKARPEGLANDLDRFIEFVTKFDPDLSGVRHLDLRFDNMIICAREKD
jgi:hypothetical protein